MFGESAIIAVLFRLINFFVLLWLAYYFFKKYIYIQIKATMLQKENEEKQLLQKKQFLIKQQEIISHEITRQEEEGIMLTNKIKTWRAAVHDFKAIEEKEFETIYHEAEQRANKQAQEEALHKLEKIIIPEALFNAKQRLIDEFSDESRGTYFLNELVNRLEKE